MLWIVDDFNFIRFISNRQINKRTLCVRVCFQWRTSRVPEIKWNSWDICRTAGSSCHLTLSLSALSFLRLGLQGEGWGCIFRGNHGSVLTYCDSAVRNELGLTPCTGSYEVEVITNNAKRLYEVLISCHQMLLTTLKKQMTASKGNCL